eukprot:jgi/Mesen1/1610/ME000134S00729
MPAPMRAIKKSSRADDDGDSNQKRLYHNMKLLRQAVKKAKQFEVRKQSRNLRQALDQETALTASTKEPVAAGKVRKLTSSKAEAHLSALKVKSFVPAEEFLWHSVRNKIRSHLVDVNKHSFSCTVSPHFKVGVPSNSRVIQKIVCTELGESIQAEYSSSFWVLFGFEQAVVLENVTKRALESIGLSELAFLGTSTPSEGKVDKAEGNIGSDCAWAVSRLVNTNCVQLALKGFAAAPASKKEEKINDEEKDAGENIMEIEDADVEAEEGEGIVKEDAARALEVLQRASEARKRKRLSVTLLPTDKEAAVHDVGVSSEGEREVETSGEDEAAGQSFSDNSLTPSFSSYDSDFSDDGGSSDEAQGPGVRSKSQPATGQANAPQKKEKKKYVKKRPGQRERQRIALLKYGPNAKHVVAAVSKVDKSPRVGGPTMRGGRGAGAGSRGAPAGRGRHGGASAAPVGRGAAARPGGSREGHASAAGAGAGSGGIDAEKVHPSWVAKAQLAKNLAMPGTGRKVKFDSDDDQD